MYVSIPVAIAVGVVVAAVASFVIAAAFVWGNMLGEKKPGGPQAPQGA